MLDDNVSAGLLVRQWTEANASWVEETRFVPEVVAAPVADSPAPWGDGLPPDLGVAPDPAAWLAALRLAGYLACDWTQLGWTNEIEEVARVALLSDACLGRQDDLAQGLEHLTRGGILLAFGHASLVNDRYALADLFGAEYAGRVQSDTEASKAVLTADTTYAPQFSPPNVIDGRPDTFWASIEAGPMPHWVQLDFARPRVSGAAQVSCRPAFLLKDFSVQARVGDEWETLATVTDNKDWVVDCPFDRPVEAQSFRLFITREELNGENRVIADVGEFTLLDEKGVRLIAPPYLIEGRIVDKSWAQSNRSERLGLRSPALRLKPTTAKVIATFADPLSGETLPLCTVNRVGKGRAYLFAVPEAAFGYAPETWEALLRALVGMPLVRHSGDEQVLAFLRRGTGRAILHVVDTAPVESPERAREVIVRVDTKALGKVKAVKALPEGTAIETRRRDGWVQFGLPIAPMGTALLELAR